VHSRDKGDGKGVNLSQYCLVSLSAFFYARACPCVCLQGALAFLARLPPMGSTLLQPPCLRPSSTLKACCGMCAGDHACLGAWAEAHHRKDGAHPYLDMLGLVCACVCCGYVRRLPLSSAEGAFLVIPSRGPSLCRGDCIPCRVTV